MKFSLALIAILGLLGIAAFVAFIVLPKMSPTPAITDTYNTDQGPRTPPDTHIDLGVSRSVNTEVFKALTAQAVGYNTLTPQGTLMVSEYAIQPWTSEHMGGEALLRKDTLGAWKLISMGGGAWSVEGLVKFGVPQSIAEQLLTQRAWQ